MLAECFQLALVPRRGQSNKVLQELCHYCYQNSILQLQVNQPKGELTQVTSVKQGQPGLQQDKRFLLQATACQNTAQWIQRN